MLSPRKDIAPLSPADLVGIGGVGVKGAGHCRFSPRSVLLSDRLAGE